MRQVQKIFWFVVTMFLLICVGIVALVECKKETRKFGGIEGSLEVSRQLGGNT